MKLIGFVVAALVAAGAAQAETAAEMEALAPLIGEWRASVRMKTEEGWTEPAVDRAVIAPWHGGQQLVEDSKIEMEGFSITLKTVFSWDQYRKTYRVIAFDQEYGLADVYEGAMEGDDLVVTNLRAGTFFVLDDGREMGFRLTWRDIGGDDFTFEVDLTLDRGESWSPYFVTEYERS